jgi:hypothetical protein
MSHIDQDVFARISIALAASPAHRPRAPMLRSRPYVEPDMALPEGKTCGDCWHFERCRAIFGHIAADEVCDWAPSRFHPKGAEVSQ